MKIQVRCCHYAKLVRISKRKRKEREREERERNEDVSVFNVCGKDKHDNMTCSLYLVINHNRLSATAQKMAQRQKIDTSTM